MKHQPLFAAVAFVMGGAGAVADELPTYQVDGFIMTRHQQIVLMPSNAIERLPASAFVYGSPHQIAVLTPRHNSPAAVGSESTPQSSENLLIRVSR